MVHLSDVSMTYKAGTHAADHLSMDIRDGEFVFLVGQSGSGKTTIIKLLTGEVRADEGEIEVTGFDLRTIKRRNLPALRRTLGVIFQDFRLIDNRNVYENVALAMHVYGARNSEIKKRVPYVLGLVGLEGRMRDMPKELSGGEQQRVAIARALANNPRTIIADEPTGNIDPELSAELMKLLSKISEQGTTMLVVTHEHDLVNQFAKRVIRIVNGRLASDSKGWYQA